MHMLMHQALLRHCPPTALDVRRADISRPAAPGCKVAAVRRSRANRPATSTLPEVNAHSERSDL